MSKFTLFWFRRDLRLEDNHGLFQALTASSHVQPIFIFDPQILKAISRKHDERVQFIHETVTQLKKELNKKGSDLWVFYEEPLKTFKRLVKSHNIEAVYSNHDYEPYAIQRDQAVLEFLSKKSISFKTYKDQVIFEKDEILSKSQKPYTVFTPYKKNWLSQLSEKQVIPFASVSLLKNLHQSSSRQSLISLKQIGFSAKTSLFPSNKISQALLKKYAAKKDFPIAKGTSRLGLHFRFGTVSVRKAVRMAKKHSEAWLSELIWREFFMQILWHFPQIETRSFRPIYDQITWRKSKKDFLRWSEGKTGYPFVDAGMRELNQTGFMPNRVRMIAASFLCKHLLIHWREGEKYFASRLLDYDLAANNGNWQWVAGSGCDAAPYFRVFNPRLQQEKFDPDLKYIRHWLPEYGSKKYPQEMIDHGQAVHRALRAYTKTLKGKRS